MCVEDSVSDLGGWVSRGSAGGTAASILVFSVKAGTCVQFSAKLKYENE